MWGFCQIVSEMRAQAKPGALGSRLLGNYEDNAGVLLLMLEILHDLNILQYLNPQGTRYPRPQTLNLRVMHNLSVSTVALIKKAFMLRSRAVGFSPSLGPDSVRLFYLVNCQDYGPGILAYLWYSFEDTLFG